MQELAIKDLTENFFEAIGKEWMLVTSGSKEKFNTMTASWGGIGFLWNKAVAFIFIRPERYTYEFIEKNDMLTLSFLGSGNRSIYNICGSKSGRDTDKIKESGLLPLTTPDGNVTFEHGFDHRKNARFKAGGLSAHLLCDVADLRVHIIEQPAEI